MRAMTSSCVTDFITRLNRSVKHSILLADLVIYDEQLSNRWQGLSDSISEFFFGHGNLSTGLELRSSDISLAVVYLCGIPGIFELVLWGVSV